MRQKKKLEGKDDVVSSRQGEVDYSEKVGALVTKFVSFVFSLLYVIAMS